MVVAFPLPASGLGSGMSCSFGHWAMRMSGWELLTKAFPHWLKRYISKKKKKDIYQERKQANKPLLFSHLLIRRRASLRTNHHTKDGRAERWKEPRSLMLELTTVLSFAFPYSLVSWAVLFTGWPFEYLLCKNIYLGILPIFFSIR